MNPPVENELNSSETKIEEILIKKESQYSQSPAFSRSLNQGNNHSILNCVKFVLTSNNVAHLT